ncbi:hypothetical protein [Nesterenkonia sp. K-15-9-6]|uniref:hypothetical protein n=1 Tax=Nesterenkonia sp. K-15-9-6 TaxID=3093918 RepID=UPI0040441D40
MNAINSLDETVRRSANLTRARVVPLKHLFSRAKTVSSGSQTLLSLYRDYGIVPKDSRDDNFNRASDDLSNYQQVNPGDLVVNKMKAWQGSVGISGYSGIISPAYFVYRPISEHPVRYFHYVFRSDVYRQAFGSISSGVRPNQWDLDPDAFGRLPVAVPPVRRAQTIADYLDHETAEIDAFIADLQKFLALSAEHLDSFWDAEFRRLVGVHPVVELRRVLRSLVDGPFGSALTSSSYSDEGAPVVRLGNIRRNRFSTEPRVYVPRGYAAQLSSHDVEPGDVVIAGLGDEKLPLGRAAVVPAEFGRGIVKADCYRARTSERVSPAYLAWALSSPAMSAAFQMMGRGTTRTRLNLGIVSAAKIPLPDRKAQENFVHVHNTAAAAHASMVDAVNRAVDLARERRAALISAAVTGQIDVTQKHRPVAEQLEDEVKQLH